MDICSIARCSARLAVTVGLLGLLQPPKPAQAHHVQGISIITPTVNSLTRTVNLLEIRETTTGSGFHTQANVKWGDAVTSNKAWTSTTGAGPKKYRVTNVSHIYADLTDRVVTVTSDTNTPVSLTDTFAAQLGCADTPKAGCDATATKVLLDIRNDADDSKDRLKFKWLKGNAATFAGGSEYYFCIYAPTLKLQAIAAGVNLTFPTATGIAYKDPAGTTLGLTKLKAKGGGPGKAKILVKGRGANLDDPLPLAQPVLVQLQSSDGQCWEHTFTSPEDANDANVFKDKEP